MADDVKLTLGIDVEALQRSASQATNVLTQAFEKGIGASLLGNGLAPTQGPSPQEQGGVRGIIDAVQQVNRTLVAGFNALAGGVYLGGGGGGGGGGGAAGGSPGLGGAGAAGGGLAPPTPGQGVAGGRFGIGAQILSRAGDLAAALMPSSMKMFMGGFYGTDVMGFMHNLVSQIPIAGRLLGAVTGPFHQVMQQNDEFKNMQYESFRDVGENAMNTFTNMWVDDDKREQFIKRYGLSRSETQQLVHAGFRSGVGGGPGRNKAIETIINMQGQLGLGTEAAGTMGALRRGGLGQGQETEVMANAIGVAVQTGLERGRWGEMLTLWQRAAQSSVDTDIAWRQVAAQQQFVGSLGERFKGDTPAAQSMIQALQAAASNAQSPLALRAAMRLTGGDYFGATARMARAAEASTPDTELEEAIINQLMGTSIAQAWLAMPDGPDADRMLDRVAGVGAAFGTGLSQLKIATLLKARKGIQGALFKGPMPQAVDIGRQQVTGGAPGPGTALGPRRSQAEAQRPSDISSIQGIGPVAPMSPGDQLRTSPIGAPTIDDLRAGRWTFDIPGVGGGSSAQPGGSYQQFIGQRFNNPIPGRSPHPGVDLMFPPGTTVTCHVDGTITTIRDSRVTGNKDETGIGIHVRDDRDGSEWKFYHLDPSTVPKDLRVGTHVSKGTVLGRTFDFAKWKDTSTRTHLHLGHVGASGAPLDPLASGAVPPGALTGGVMPSVGGGSAPGGVSSAGGSGAQQVDVHLYIHQDQAGRPVVRARGPGVHAVSSPGQLVGGHR